MIKLFFRLNGLFYVKIFLTKNFIIILRIREEKSIELKNYTGPKITPVKTIGDSYRFHVSKWKYGNEFIVPPFFRVGGLLLKLRYFKSC